MLWSCEICVIYFWKFNMRPFEWCGIEISFLKETRNWFKKWPLNYWWISNKTIMKTGNVTKAATFKSFLHQSYKNTQLLFFVTVLFNYFHETNINRRFLGVTQKYELRVSFNFRNVRKLLTLKMAAILVIFLYFTQKKQYLVNCLRNCIKFSTYTNKIMLILYRNNNNKKTIMW